MSAAARVCHPDRLEVVGNGIASGHADIPRGPVIYWMRRAQRELHNAALEVTIACANELGRSVVVVFIALEDLRSRYPRVWAFMLDGLAETATAIGRRGIPFVTRVSRNASTAQQELARIATLLDASCIVVDDNVMRPRTSDLRLASMLYPRILLRVDTDLVVPARLIGREHHSARTIRPVIKDKIDQFLALPVGQKIKVSWNNNASKELASLSRESDDLLRKMGQGAVYPPRAHLRGGTSQALKRLTSFLQGPLNGYAQVRRNIGQPTTSQLSPYLHFGQIGPLTVAKEVIASPVSETDKDAFLEQLIVRRELAANFVFYNRRYRTVACGDSWALRTLERHANDPRPVLYAEHDLEQARTHDDLWNAAQRQLVDSGWMDGYMRMYWAKKILEWSRDVEQAYKVALWLNDYYELDGRDPNGYAGIAWSIVGKHDRPFGPERPVFGMIRYMSGASLYKRKGVREYIDRWLRKS